MFEGSCVRDTSPSMQRIVNHFKATQDIGEVCIENLIEIEHDSWCGVQKKQLPLFTDTMARNGFWQRVSRFMVCGEMGNTVDED